MEIEYIRQFALLARDCHFQSAADELFISQSALSVIIEDLYQQRTSPAIDDILRLDPVEMHG